LVFQTGIANLMLWDKYNNTVWQSFDHPTNQILQGQSMLPNGDPVYSSLDENSQTEGIGNYSLVMGEGGLILSVTLANETNPLPYWAYGYYGSNYTSSITSTCNLPIHAEFFANLTGTQYVVVLRQSSSNVTNNGTLNACGASGAINVTSLPPKGLFKLDPKVVGGVSVKKTLEVDFRGQLVLVLWNSPHDAATVAQPLFGADEPCKLPKICYQYGVCNPMSTTQCSCPSSSNASESFTPRTPSDLSQGCSVPGEHVSCDNGSTANQYFVRLSAIDYFANDFTEPLQTTMNNCTQTCLQNCKCYAAFYRITSTECFHTFQPVMTLINQSDSNYVAFIKLQKSSTRALSSSSDMDRTRNWLVGVGGGVLGVIALILFLSLLWRGKFIGVHHLTEEDIFLETLPGLPPRYQFKELEVATEKFAHKLGQGGFGVVYKGILADGTEVAVKRLEGDSFGQGQKEFRAEVATIGNIHHFNLVRLCGFCVEGSYRMLVYEFMEHGSLDRLLFRKILVEEGEDAVSLDWLNRLNIAICTARGLAYLHEECREKILHLDIKPQNILLDKNFVAKVADFGLAKLTKRDQSLVMTQMRGTPGYLAPEWLLLGAVTEKADVYSYGMVLLELISGRRNIERALDIERWFFPAWALKMYACGNVMELVDKRLEFERPSKAEVRRVLRIAFWCIQEDGSIRPSMGFVVQMLEGHMEVHEPPINFDFLETTQKMVAKIMHSFSSPFSLGTLKTPIREEGEPPNPPNTTTYEPPNCVIYEDLTSMEMDLYTSSV
jgi:serine/threonine protein kinase